MMAEKLPPEAQTHVTKYQQLQNMLTQILTEKATLESELREINRILSTLEKVGEDEELYKAVGHILVKTSKEEVRKELEEKKELLELKLKALEKQEKEVRRQLEEVQAKLKEIIAKTYQAYEKTLRGQAG